VAVYGCHSGAGASHHYPAAVMVMVMLGIYAAFVFCDLLIQYANG
jgi:hypothetical protein